MDYKQRKELPPQRPRTTPLRALVYSAVLEIRECVLVFTGEEDDDSEEHRQSAMLTHTHTHTVILSFADSDRDREREKETRGRGRVFVCGAVQRSFRFLIGRLICIEVCVGMRLHDEGSHIIVGGGGYWGPSQETSFFVTDPHEMWGPISSLCLTSAAALIGAGLWL